MPTHTTPVLPPDKGTVHRSQVDHWAKLWKAEYTYDQVGTSIIGSTTNGTPVLSGSIGSGNDAPAAPGYTRGICKLVAGLFQRQPPRFETPPADTDTSPLTMDELADLLEEVASKSAGYGCVVVRPVFDGIDWKPAVLTPTRFRVRWAHRRVNSIVMWDYSSDPRETDPASKKGLALVETWTAGTVENGTQQPGTVATEIWETDETGGPTRLTNMLSIDTDNEALAGHPFFVSARNDTIERDLFAMVWDWEDGNPVPIFYPNEHVLEGLAKLWDQEQDDAEMTRRRIAMPEQAVGKNQVTGVNGAILANPGFLKRQNLLTLSDQMSAQHGPSGGVTPIEFDDDLVQRQRIESRENSILEIGFRINPQSIGRSVTGQSDSGAAKRADNQMSLNTISSPARKLSRVLTAVVAELSRLNGRAPTSRRSADMGQVIVTEGLRDDPTELASQTRDMADSESASVKTRVKTLHPTWSDDLVDAEVALIQAEQGRIPIE